MLVDWFTVAAQVVNFLVLVALLKRFLYRPILTAMDAREARIADQLAEAQKKKESAEANHAAYLQEYQAIEARRQELLVQAEKDAAAHKEELVRKLRQEVEDLRARWLETLTREQDLFFQDVRQLLIRQIAAVSRRALHDLAGLDLEPRLVEVFLGRLQNLEAKSRNEFVEAAQEAGGQVVITSGLEIPAEMRGRIIQALNDLSGKELTPRFETAAEVISGIEVKAGGCKIAWSVENFLQGLEETLMAAFEEKQGRRLP